MARYGKRKNIKMPKRGKKSAASRFAMPPGSKMVSNTIMAPSAQVKAELKLEKGYVPRVQRSTRRKADVTTTKLVSGNKRAARPMSIWDITNTIAPKFAIYKTGFANNWNNRLHGSAMTGVEGLDKSVNIEPGKGAWREYLGLPLFNPKVGVSKDGFSFSVAALMIKSLDIINQTNASRTEAIPTDEGDVFGYYNDNRTFDYLGGGQRHFFKNTGNSDVIITFNECVPRERLCGLRKIEGGTANQYQSWSVMQDLLKSYASETPYTNTVNPTYPDADSNDINDMVDDTTDFLVRINPKSTQVHLRYLVSSSKTVRLSPGDEITYDMKFPAFNFMSSAFANLINESEVNSTADYEAQWPLLIPMFTKILTCKFTTEVGHSDETGTTTTSYAKVGTLPGICLHTCTEYHECRALPYQQKFAAVRLNYLDVSEDVKVGMDTDNGVPELFKSDV